MTLCEHTDREKEEEETRNVFNELRIRFYQNEKKQKLQAAPGKNREDNVYQFN